MITFLNKQKSTLANFINGNPSDRIRVIGVTGTRGKTIVVHMLHQLFRDLGVNVGFLSSYGYTLDNEHVYTDKNANNIKPGDVHKMIGEMAKNGVEFAFIEITSANLKNKNYEGVILDSGIITNIYEDNISRYKDMDEYITTKLDFIKMIRDEGLLIVQNHNQDISARILQATEDLKHSIFTYWTEESEANDITNYIDSISFSLDNQRYSLPVVSNLSNAIQAIRLAQAYFPKAAVKHSFEAIKSMPGHMQVIKSEPFTIIVDHSKNKETIETSLLYLNSIKEKGANIISVVGSPGDEKDTRNIGIPLVQNSSLVILCASDPKKQRVYDINTEIEEKAKPFHGIVVERLGSTEEYEMINKHNLKLKIDRVRKNGDTPIITFDADDYTSRLDAIDFAISMATANDIVYIAGKGSENSLKFSKVEYEWGDEEAVGRALVKD